MHGRGDPLQGGPAGLGDSFSADDCHMGDGPLGGVRDKKAERRARLLQEEFLRAANPPPPACKSCDELRKSFQDHTSKYYKEAMHLRGAIDKLLEQCGACMPKSAFDAFRDSLQLGVRYLTSHSDKEQVIKSSSKGAPSVDVGALRKKIKQLEFDLEESGNENLQLFAELEKLRGNKAEDGGSAPAPRAPRRTLAATKESREVQTEPMQLPSRPAPAEGGSKEPPQRRPPTPPPARKARPESPRRSDTPPAKKGKKLAPVEEPEAKTKKPKAVVEREAPEPKERRERLEPTACGTCSELERQLAKVTAERDLLQMKLASAEREGGKMKDEVAKLKKQLQERDGEVDALEKELEAARKRIKELEVLLAAPKKGPAGSPKFASRVRKPKPAQEPGEPQPVEEEESEEEEEEEVQMVDEEAQTDEVPDDWDQFKQVRGKPVRKMQETTLMNYTGHTFIQKVRSFPELRKPGASGLAGVPPPGVPGRVVRELVSGEKANSTSPAKRKVTVSGAPVRGREFDLGALSSTGYRAPGPAASPWQGREIALAASAIAADKQVEPYLMKVWDTTTTGHKQPAKLELANLGAVQDDSPPDAPEGAPAAEAVRVP